MFADKRMNNVDLPHTTHSNNGSISPITGVIELHYKFITRILRAERGTVFFYIYRCN